MKRTFRELDRAIADEVWEMFPTERCHVEQSAQLEEKANGLLNHRFRSIFAANSDVKAVEKCVRVVIRHEFLPKSEFQDRGNYVLTIEGHVLDPSYRHAVPFASLFRSVSIQVDRKTKLETTPGDLLEWNRITASSLDLHSVAFRTVIPNNENGRPFVARLSFERECAGAPRYEVSDILLNAFPNIILQENKTVTEDEVLFYIWTYIQENKLLEGRDNRRVKCDERLFKLFGLDTVSGAASAAAAGAPVGVSGNIVMLNMIRARLMDDGQSPALLVPVNRNATTKVPTGAENSHKIVVDYPLNSTYNTVFDTAKDLCGCPSTIIKNGGKSFDMEVYLNTAMLDFRGHNPIALLNQSANGAITKEIQHNLDKHYHQCFYMAKQINAMNNRLNDIHRKQTQHVIDTVLSTQRLTGPSKYGHDQIGGLLIANQPTGESVMNSVKRLRTVDSDNVVPLLSDEQLIEQIQETVVNHKLYHSEPVHNISILHVNSDYVDIGNDKQFVTVAAKKLL